MENRNMTEFCNKQNSLLRRLRKLLTNIEKLLVKMMIENKYMLPKLLFFIIKKQFVIKN